MRDQGAAARTLIRTAAAVHTALEVPGRLRLGPWKRPRCRTSRRRTSAMDSGTAGQQRTPLWDAVVSSGAFGAAVAAAAAEGGVETPRPAATLLEHQAESVAPEAPCTAGCTAAVGSHCRTKNLPWALAAVTDAGVQEAAWSRLPSPPPAVPASARIGRSSGQSPSPSAGRHAPIDQRSSPAVAGVVGSEER